MNMACINSFSSILGISGERQIQRFNGVKILFLTAKISFKRLSNIQTTSVSIDVTQDRIKAIQIIAVWFA